MSTHITNVTLTGFNRLVKSIRLSEGLNFIIGPNGSGKSSIWQAIEFATSGEITGYPKRKGEIMKRCASGLTMASSVTFSDATSITRTLTRKGTSVTSKATGDAAADGRVLIAPTCLSIQPFLAATAKERAAMILAASGGDVEAVVNKALADTGLGAKIKKPSIHEFEDFGDWLKANNEEATARASSIRLEVESMKGTIRGMEILAETTVTPDLNSKIANAQDALRKKQAQTRELEKEISAVEAVLAFQRTQIKALRKPEGEKPTEDAHGNAATAQEQYIAARQLFLEARNYELAVSRRKVKLQEIEMQIAEEKANLEHTKGRTVNEIQTDLSTALAELAKHREELRTAMSNGDKNETCPSCGASHEHWTTRKKITGEGLREMQNKIDEAKSKVDEFQEELAMANAHIESQRELARLTADQEGIHEEINHDPLADTISTKEAEERVAIAQRNTEDCAARATMAHLWAVYETKLEEQASLTDGIEKKENEHLAKSDLLRMEQRDMHQAEENLSELLTQATERDAAAERESVANQAAAKLKESEADLESMTKAIAEFNASIKSQLGELLRPIIESCEVFSRDLLPSMLTVENLEIGYWKTTDTGAKEWYSIDAMNRSNRAIAIIALQVALAANSPGIKIVFLDEFSVIDDSRKGQVIANLEIAWTKAVLDQCIICDNRRPEKAASFNVIDL